MLALGNSVHGLKPKHKHLLYRSCVMPIVLYRIRLWHYNGARFKGTMKELTKVQRRTVIWILGAFKTTPMGAAEFLAGLIPIDLQIQKLIYRNHIRMHTLANSHITCIVAAGENQACNVSYLPSKLSKKAKSPLIDMWANEKLVSIDVIPFNEFNAPGTHLLDRFQEHISFDIVLISGKNAKE